jgi:hypothetical protein
MLSPCLPAGLGFSFAALGITVALLLCSLVLGYAVGKILIVLMWFKRVPTRYLILPLGLAIFVAANAMTEYSHESELTKREWLAFHLQWCDPPPFLLTFLNRLVICAEL